MSYFSSGSSTLAISPTETYWPPIFRASPVGFSSCSSSCTCVFEERVALYLVQCHFESCYVLAKIFTGVVAFKSGDWGIDFFSNFRARGLIRLDLMNFGGLYISHQDSDKQDRNLQQLNYV